MSKPIKMFIVLCAIAAVMFLAGHFIGQRAERNAVSRDIIQKVKKSYDLEEQYQRTHDLFLYMKDHKCSGIEQNTIDDLTSLLRMRHDGVRYWAVRTLSRIGPCAKTAIPQLKLIVREADCWPGGLTSAFEIRATLTKLGEPPISKTICTGYGQGHAS